MRVAPLVLALALLALTAGCDSAGEDPSEEQASAAPAIHQYVALGDSYTAEAGVAPVDSSGSCQRSTRNYPALIARALGADLHDASCGGAATDDATSSQRSKDGTVNPPQLSGLTSSTDLVTVSLGYNNHGWFGGLVTCALLARTDPAGHPCQDAKAAHYQPAVAQSIAGAVLRTLQEVRDRSPDARVLLVGYPQWVPAEGTCTELPLAAGDYAFVRSSLQLLDTELRRAAGSAGVTYVDVMAASGGHDVCAGDDAWVNGSVARPGAAVTYHPFAAEQRAVAQLVLAQLQR
jgi:hypothetical protein